MRIFLRISFPFSNAKFSFFNLHIWKFVGIAYERKDENKSDIMNSKLVYFLV